MNLLPRCRLLVTRAAPRWAAAGSCEPLSHPMLCPDTDVRLRECRFETSPAQTARSKEPWRLSQSRRVGHHRGIPRAAVAQAHVGYAASHGASLSLET